MKPKINDTQSSTTARLKRAIVRELVGHLILLVPAVLVFCIGLLLAREIEAYFDQRHAVYLTLTDQEAFVELNQCPVLRGDRVLEIKDIQASSTNQRRVDCEYRDARSSEAFSGTAQFAWRQGAWHAVVCR